MSEEHSERDRAAVKARSARNSQVSTNLRTEDARPWRKRHDIVFLLLTLGCVLLLLALFSYRPGDVAWSVMSAAPADNAAGRVGAFIADVLLHAFGYLAYLLPALIIAKLWLLFRKAPTPESRIWLQRGMGLILTLLALSTLSTMSIWQGESLPAGSGGIIGDVLVTAITPLFGFAGTALIMIVAVALGLVLFLEFSWLRLFERLGEFAINLVPRDEINETHHPVVEKHSYPSTHVSEATSQGWLSKLKERFSFKSFSFKRATPAAHSHEHDHTIDDAFDEDEGFFSKNDINDRVRHGQDQSPQSWLEHADADIDFDADVDFDDDSDLDSKLGSELESDSVYPTHVVPNPKPLTKSQAPAAPWSTSDSDSKSASDSNTNIGKPASGKFKSWDDHVSQQLRDEFEQDSAKPAEKDIPIQPLERRESRLSERAQRDQQSSIFKAPDPLPSISLLDPPRTNQKPGFSPERLREMSVLLVNKLADFGVKIEVTAVAPGPVITRFEIQPAPGVKASKISNLAKDLARSMAMTSVRVVEVIPGKSVMGIEVPNEDRAVVSLKEVLSSEEYDNSKSPLTLALGHDIAGNPVITDLAKMPHLLVAGTTGSGKSVGVNAMLISLLFKATPDELRLILVDPKMLELSVYEGIPHLLTPVITDMKEAASGLRWSVAEMERRYKLMAAMGVRNLAGFNKKVNEAIAAGKPLPDPLWRIDQSFDTTPPTLEPLPYVVIVIDEFADMMMMVGKKVEELIARIAQKARAAGIHMILATQRPSVDVITGLIKANVPTRIAFQVSSKIDSRTILDQGGAEQLLGHGDMLFMPPGNALPERVHGAFVDDDEVHRVVAEWKLRGEPNYIEEITQIGEDGNLPGVGGGDTDGEQDELYDQAVSFVTESGKCSISSVQRKLRIGYNRAARLVESMESAGVVSPPAHNGTREVLAGSSPSM